MAVVFVAKDGNGGLRGSGTVDNVNAGVRWTRKYSLFVTHIWHISLNVEDGYSYKFVFFFFKIRLKTLSLNPKFSLLLHVWVPLCVYLEHWPLSHRKIFTSWKFHSESNQFFQTSPKKKISNQNRFKPVILISRFFLWSYLNFGVLMVLCGILCLGLAGDLGIAAGVFAMVNIIKRKAQKTSTNRYKFQKQ